VQPDAALQDRKMIKPNSETELAAAITDAAGPLRIIGGGTRSIGHVVSGQDLSVAGLTGIELYEPGSLTIVARAGTPLSEIEAALDEHDQRLAFEPMDHCGLLGTSGVPTIGGVVAANVSGPRRVQVGACRDYLLGVRFVDGRGRIIKNGGRVMKNVTGYDLAKLMAGSFGTLGVLSEVAFKVLPTPGIAATLEIDGLSDAEGQRAMSLAIRSPFEITGASIVSQNIARNIFDSGLMIALLC
jgi:glycolate oxidase FAD binding subunit